MDLTCRADAYPRQKHHGQRVRHAAGHARPQTRRAGQARLGEGQQMVSVQPTVLRLRLPIRGHQGFGRARVGVPGVRRMARPGRERRQEHPRRGPTPPPATVGTQSEEPWGARG